MVAAGCGRWAVGGGRWAVCGKIGDGQIIDILEGGVDEEDRIHVT